LLLLSDLDELWKMHCQTDFKSQDREKGENWRNVYKRALKEREDKLGAIARQIKKKTDLEKQPVKKTKAINAMASKSRSKFSFHSSGSSSASSSASSSSSSHSATTTTAASIKATATQSRMAAVKPRKGPLMVKTMKLMKNNRFR